MNWEEAKLDSALLERRTVRPVDFPGAPHIKLGVRMLSESELDGCKRQAQRVTEEQKAEGIFDFFDRVLERVVVARAFVNIKTVGVEGKEPEPFFADQQYVAELDGVVVTQLYRLYMEHCKDADPLIYEDEDGVRELVKRLGKEPFSRAHLSGYAHETLVTLCAFLASAVRATSPQPSSPTGSS